MAVRLRYTFNMISIHALREEGDCFHLAHHSCADDFYPRPPRGGRRPCPLTACGGLPISIHALREEGDLRACACTWTEHNFYPRPPRGGRPLAAFLI